MTYTLAGKTYDPPRGFQEFLEEKNDAFTTNDWVNIGWILDNALDWDWAFIGFVQAGSESNPSMAIQVARYVVMGRHEAEKQGLFT